MVSLSYNQHFLARGNLVPQVVASGPVPEYERTAFISTTGDNSTAELNNPTKPFDTVSACLSLLAASYAGSAVTIRLLDDLNSGNCDGNYFGYGDPVAGFTSLTFMGHEGIRVMSMYDGMAFDGFAGNPGTSVEGFNGGNGGAGGDGLDIILDAITLTISFMGFPIMSSNGGNGGDGGAGDGGQGGEGYIGGNGGNGGDGGDITFINGATNVSVSLSAAGGSGGAYGSGNGGDGSPGSNGNNGTITP